MSDMNRFELSEDEHQKWFENLILPMFALDKKSSPEPTFVLLTGQSGAGKTYSSLKYAQKMNEEPIRFGADDLRLLLPYAVDAMREDEKNYPFLTKKDAGLAREKLVDHAIANRKNILIESILSNPNDWKMGTILKAKEAGYKIECVALGVHRYLSEVSMFSRYEDQKAINGLGFAPTLDVHNKAYDLLPEIAGKMLENGVADSLCVYNREFECFYDSRQDGKVSQLEVMKAINRSRNSSLNYDEMCKIAVKWDMVLEAMAKRNANSEDMELVKMLSANFRKNTVMYLTQAFKNSQSKDR